MAKKAAKEEVVEEVVEEDLITVRRFNKETANRFLLEIPRADLIATGYYADVIVE
tara:strand:+ start:171 stop:335 length:165 start_codon:yes stop_codon:yes gene_type:complete